MNNRAISQVFIDEHLIDAALTSLKISSGISGHVELNADNSDGRVVLHVAGTRLTYRGEIKRTVDRIAMLEDVKVRSCPDQKTLLITTLLTNAMAERCQELGIEFIDTAGNVFITDGAGILINIRGRKTIEEANARSEKTITPAALRMMFAFLAQPSMLNEPYREISTAAQVSTGAIGAALQTMETRGFIGTTAGGRRIINSPEQMLSEWATGYASRLRPKLKKFRFAAPESGLVLEQWHPEMRVSAWGAKWRRKRSRAI